MTITLYRHPLSGHSHRVELFLALLGLPSRSVDVDLASAEHKKEPFLAKNPFGQLPVIEDGATTVADSNAILVYLARRHAPDSAWLPKDDVALAEVQRWLSIAAGPLAEGPARARVAAVFGRAMDVEPSRTIARALFLTMDAHLARASFLVGETPTVADIALYTYTAHAPEGGVSLAPFPNVRAWIARIEAMPRFVPMKATATAALASAS